MLTSERTVSPSRPRLHIKPKESGSTNQDFHRRNRRQVVVKYEEPFWQLKSEAEFRRKYKVCEKIGRGAFTVVHRCYDKRTRKQYAARFIRIGRDLGTREMVARELEIMGMCKDERLVTFHEAYDLGSYVVMILEYIPCGELSDRIVREDPRMTEDDARDITRQICEGIAYLHRHKIAHLDLKPENVLCMSNDTNDIKLIDFGLARRLDVDSVVRLLFATPEFCAPEIVNYETINYSTDMWSIGVMTFVMLSAMSPFLGDNDNETLANVADASWDFQDECWDSISYEAKDFISRLLIKPKELRMSIEDALHHPWLKEKCPRMEAPSCLVQRLHIQDGGNFPDAHKDFYWSI